MPKPILNSARIVPRIRQRVAAGVAQHVGVHREAKAGAPANALDKPIDGVRGERPASLGLEDKAACRLPMQLAQGAYLVASQRMDARLAVLSPSNMQ